MTTTKTKDVATGSPTAPTESGFTMVNGIAYIDKVGIDDEDVKDFRGKDHVLFKALLDRAHRFVGIRNTHLEFVQIPSKDNGDRTILLATIEFADGTTYQEVGDCDAASLGKASMVLPHAIRMAATRAYGRVLRMKLNIAESMTEEFGGSESAAPARQQERAAPAQRQAPPPTPPAPLTSTTDGAAPADKPTLDRILKINDDAVASFNDIPYYVSTNLGTPVRPCPSPSGRASCS